MQLPITRQLKDATWVELDRMQSGEEEIVRSHLNAIIAEGMTYPQAEPLSLKDFADYWLKGEAFVARGYPSTLGMEAKPAKIVGAFYIKPNFPGRCGHICNAGFIVPPESRGQGLGRIMGETMVVLARDLGYRAVMYNLVFETNTPSLKIWDSLGFREIGRIPAAAHLPDGRYVDAIMLYKSLLKE